MADNSIIQAPNANSDLPTNEVQPNLNPVEPQNPDQPGSSNGSGGHDGLDARHLVTKVTTASNPIQPEMPEGLANMIQMIVMQSLQQMMPQILQMATNGQPQITPTIQSVGNSTPRDTVTPSAQLDMYPQPQANVNARPVFFNRAVQECKGNSLEEIKLWFEILDAVSDRHCYSNADKVSCVTIYFREKAREILNSLPPDTRSNYEQLRSTIIARFQHPGYQVQMEQKFHERKQHQNETASELATDLQKMFSEAFPSFAPLERERLLISQFRRSLKHNSLRAEIARSDPHTLEEAVRVVTRIEFAIIDGESERRQLRNTTVAHIADDQYCRHCRKNNHSEDDCWFKSKSSKTDRVGLSSRNERGPEGQIICTFCKRPNHHESVCYQKKRQHDNRQSSKYVTSKAQNINSNGADCQQVSAEEFAQMKYLVSTLTGAQDTENDDDIHADGICVVNSHVNEINTEVSTKGTRPRGLRSIVAGKINSVDAKILVDTGADNSFISLSYLSKHSTLRAIPVDTSCLSSQHGLKVTNADNKPFPIVGRIKATIQIGSESKLTTFYVARSTVQDVFLGTDIISEFGGVALDTRTQSLIFGYHKLIGGIAVPCVDDVRKNSTSSAFLLKSHTSTHRKIPKWPKQSTDNSTTQTVDAKSTISRSMPAKQQQSHYKLKGQSQIVAKTNNERMMQKRTSLLMKPQLHIPMNIKRRFPPKRLSELQNKLNSDWFRLCIRNAPIKTSPKSPNVTTKRKIPSVSEHVGFDVNEGLNFASFYT